MDYISLWIHCETWYFWDNQPSSPSDPSPKQLTSWLLESGERKLWECKKRRVSRCWSRMVEPHAIGFLHSFSILQHHTLKVYTLPSWTWLSMCSLYYPITVHIIQKLGSCHTLHAFSREKHAWPTCTLILILTCCPLPEPYLTSWEWSRTLFSELASLRAEPHVTNWNPAIRKALS